MKGIILVAILVAAAFCEYEVEFAEFVGKHNKVYASKEEASKRFGIFKETMKKINEHNANGERTFDMGINKFSDLTYEEFSSVYLMAPRIIEERIEEEVPSVGIENVDWRQKGAVTGVRDQGNCGGCYSFAATGSIEGVCKIKTGTLFELSEQQCLDCSNSYGNKGCSGGMPERCMRYYVGVGGVELRSSYPFAGVVGTCKFDKSKVVVKIGSPTVVSGEAKTQSAIVGQPTAVALYATAKFQSYKSGIFVDTTCPNNTINHGLTGVGLGSASGQDYYIIKNSWGTGWGESGYVRFRANNNGMCGIGTDNSYTTSCSKV